MGLRSGVCEDSVSSSPFLNERDRDIHCSEEYLTDMNNCVFYIGLRVVSRLIREEEVWRP